MFIDKFERFYHLFHDSTYVFMGHRHNSYEVNIVLHGCLEITCADSVFRLTDGEFAMWRPGIFHCNRVLSSDGTEFISLHFLSADSSIEAEIFNCKRSTGAPQGSLGAGNAAVFKLSESDLAIVKVIDEEMTKASSGASLVAHKLLEALISRLGGKETAPKLATTGNPAVYHRAVQLMSELISEPLSVTDIAKQCGVCTTTLKNAFAECAGKGVGVKSYFLEMKLEKAKEMLGRGTSVESVSNALGFSSPAYFSQCFKRETGRCPGEFKTNKF